MINTTNVVPVTDVREAMGYMPCSTFWARVKAGLIPRPFKIGGASSRAVPSGITRNELNVVLAAQIAGKSEDEIKRIVISLETKREEVFQSLYQDCVAA